MNNAVFKKLYELNLIYKTLFNKKIAVYIYFILIT